MSVAGALQDLIEPRARGALDIRGDGRALDVVPTWRVEAFFTEAPDPATLTREVEELLGALHPGL